MDIIKWLPNPETDLVMGTGDPFWIPVISIVGVVIIITIFTWTKVRKNKKILTNSCFYVMHMNKKIKTSNIDVVYMILGFSLGILGCIFWDIVKEFIQILSQQEDKITSGKFASIFLYGIFFLIIFSILEHIIKRNIELSKAATQMLDKFVWSYGAFLFLEVFIFLCISFPQILRAENIYEVAIDISCFRIFNYIIIFVTIVILQVYFKFQKNICQNSPSPTSENQQTEKTSNDSH